MEKKNNKKIKQKTKKITRESNIAELVMEHPEVSEVLLAFGLHCVGCFASQFDTIGQGAEIHGMPDDEINELLDEVNKVINNPELMYG